jgi:hypothetical protein
MTHKADNTGSGNGTGQTVPSGEDTGSTGSYMGSRKATGQTAHQDGNVIILTSNDTS